MLDHSTGAGTHTFAERGQDCYETPPEAVHALLKVEKLPEFIWEPACGSGNISRVLEAAGHNVISSDLYDHGYGTAGIDFFKSDSTADAIVTNPPYQHAHRFVEHALQSAPRVIMLLRLAFLESERRTNILENSGLERIHVFANRLPLMHRKGWDGPRASSAMCFAWYSWRRGYEGPTQIDRIRWSSVDGSGY